MSASLIGMIVLYAVPMIFAITLHEAAHGYIARMFGDRTAERLGRITLNPLKHIDLVGTIAVPLGILLIGKLTGANIPPFGWAKPVPVDFRNLRHPKRDMFWVAAAGPAANLAMALAWALVWKVGAASDAIRLMSEIGMISNFVLLVLNLVPILPLDGGRIAVSLLPHGLAIRYARFEPFGMILVVLLLATGLLGGAIWPVVQTMRNALATLLGL